MMFFEATDHKYHLCNLRSWFHMSQAMLQTKNISRLMRKFCEKANVCEGLIINAFVINPKGMIFVISSKCCNWYRTTLCMMGSCLYWGYRRIFVGHNVIWYQKKSFGYILYESIGSLRGFGDVILSQGSDLWKKQWTIRNSCHPLQWRHDEHDGVLNHRRLDCLFSRLFRCRLKKTSKISVTGLCEGKPLMTLAKGN